MREQNQDFLAELKGAVIETQLDFLRNWGLGSSSTLINNIAQWANVNPFDLQQKSFLEEVDMILHVPKNLTLSLIS